MNKQNVKANIQKNYIVTHWKSIIIFAVFFSIIIGGGKIIIDINAWTNDMSTFKEDLQNYKQEKSDFKKQYAKYPDEIDTLQDHVDEQQAYIDNAILMQIDYEQETRMITDLFVQTESTNQTQVTSLIHLYANNLMNSTDWDKIAGEMGTDAEYIKELVYVEENAGASTVRLQIIAPNDTIANDVMSGIIKDQESRHNDLVSIAGEYTVQRMNDKTEVISDWDTQTRQTDATNRLADYEQQLIDKQAEYENATEPAWPTSEPSRKRICLSALLYGVIGFIAGLILMIFFYYAKFIYSNTFYLEEDFAQYSGFRVLGSYTNKKKHKHFQKIDVWLDRITGVKEFTPEETQKRIQLNVSTISDEMKSIVVTGTVTEAELQSVVDNLKKDVPERAFVTCVNPAYETEALAELVACDGVILVEKKAVSKCTKIQELVKQIVEVKKEVVGAVLL